MIELYVEVFLNDNVSFFSNNLPRTSNRINDTIVSANKDNQRVDEIDSSFFDLLE
jgi:hypothetical protein